MCTVAYIKLDPANFAAGGAASVRRHLKYKILKLVMCSFGLCCIFLTEMGVTSL